jgi:hypothetical protein
MGAGAGVRQVRQSQHPMTLGPELLRVAHTSRNAITPTHKGCAPLENDPYCVSTNSVGTPASRHHF